MYVLLDSIHLYRFICSLLILFPVYFVSCLGLLCAVTLKVQITVICVGVCCICHINVFICFRNIVSDSNGWTQAGPDALHALV